MAKVTVDYPRLPDTGGTYTTVQSGLVVVSYADGATDTLRGDFTYANGFITGGFITSEIITVGGATVMSITDIRVSAITYFNARLAGDAATIGNLIWGGPDEVFGASGADLIGGLTGNDTVIALDGNDTVTGGAGDDDVNGNVGQDVVHGDDGADFVRGGRDNDTIYGDAGDDLHVNGNIGNDLVHGGIGNDTVYGGQDQDTLRGDAGNDDLSGDLGNDILYGDAGADRFILRAGGGFDWVADFKPGEGDRIMLASGTAYTVSASGGQVVIDINGGADHLGLAGVAAGSFSADWIVFG